MTALVKPRGTLQKAGFNSGPGRLTSWFGCWNHWGRSFI